MILTPMKLRVSQETYLMNDQCAPPEMRIQPWEIEVLLGTLREHHLVTDFVFPNVSRDSDLPIWGEFDLRLRDYLSSIGAEFANPSSFSSCNLPTSSDQNPPTEYHNLPWLLLTGGRVNCDRQKITPAGPLTFSPKTLCSHAIGGVWGKAASGTPNQPLLLIGTSI